VPGPDPQQALTRIRQLFGPRLEQLAGARFEGEIPLSEAVLNALLVERLQAADSPVESAQMQIRRDGELFVRVRLRRPSFAPAVIIGLRIEQQADLPRSTVLALRWWLPGLGLLAAFAAPALAFLKAGPPWLVMDREHLLVDIARLFRDQGAEDLLTYLSDLHVTTREGAVLVRFKLGVAPPPT
jgi:hypothetical protein